MRKKIQHAVWEHRFHHRSVPELYRRLIRELAAIDIDEPSDYRRYRDARKYFVDYDRLRQIEFGFTRNMIDLLPKVADSIAAVNGLSIVIRETSPNLDEAHRKKLAVYSR